MIANQGSIRETPQTGILQLLWLWILHRVRTGRKQNLGYDDDDYACKVNDDEDDDVCGLLFRNELNCCLDEVKLF